MTDPGWYSEPGNPAVDRYWDGAQWTPQTRPAAVPDLPPPVVPASGSWEERVANKAKADEAITRAFGPGAGRVCPHCQTRGGVTSKMVKQKKGISGGKATAAVFTAGISMLGTGLSRKEKVTELYCSNCGTTWHV